MKKTMTKIFALVLVLAMVIGFVAMIPAQAAEIDSVVVAYHNVYFEDYLQIMYAVYVPDGKTIDSIKLSDGTNEFAAVPYSDDKPIPQYNGKDCQLFVAATGVSLQNIDTVVTAEVYVEGQADAAATDTYSVLEYLHKRLTVDDLTGLDAEKAMYESLLDTAEKMQTVINGDVTLHDTSYVHVTNGTIDGINADGMVTVGQTLSGVTCDLILGENQKVVWTVTEYDDAGVAGVPAQKTPEQVNALVVEEGVNLVLSAELTEADAPTTKEIVFELGEDGEASHSESTADKATYTETVEGYTLSLTNGSKMYPNSRDAQGNGAIKMGASSTIGQFTMTVPNDVSKVIIYVAGRTNKTVGIKINDEAQTISTLSDNGEYTPVEIDTTVTKTIVFETTSSGYRAMINTIVYVAMVCSHEDTTPVEAKAATCTEIGYEENTVFCNDCQCYISGGEIAATGHQNTVNQNVVAPTCVDVGTHDVFCNDCETTIQTGVETPATGVHTYVDGTCSVCGAADPNVGGGETGTPITASKTIAELITEYGWTSSTTKQEFKLDDNVTVKIDGGSNSGKAYNNDHIRIYATDSPAGSITISVPEGYELVSVNVSTKTGTYAYLCVDGTTTDISNQKVDVSGNSVLLNSVKNGTNGKQVQVTAIEVVYRATAAASSLCVNEIATPVSCKEWF